MAQHRPLLLLIENERQIRRLLRSSLGSHGYSLLEAETGQIGLDTMVQRQPDLVILDLELPDINGLELLRQAREWSTRPILAISSRSKERDKVAALDMGADDYLTKPFSVAELSARIRVALRHAIESESDGARPNFSSGALRVDLVRQQVFIDGEEIHLTPLEYELLATLVRNAGKVLTHGQLLSEVWGLNNSEKNAYLRVYVNQLRQKLRDNATHPRYVRTEPGVGYRLLVS